MQISENRDSLSRLRTICGTNFTGEQRLFPLARVFSRFLPHILSNKQGERGKFTIFYPFLLKERRLHTHEAECIQPRCAFWFQVSEHWVIQGRSPGDRPLSLIICYVRIADTLRIGEQFVCVN